MSKSPPPINMPSPEAGRKEGIDNDESQHLLEKKTYEKGAKTEDEKVVMCSGKLLWLWIVSFIFMTAYQASFFTFGQYVYIKLQRENFPNVTIDSTKSLCETNTSSDNYKIQVDVQELAAKWGIYYYLAGGITSVIFNFVLGAFTDRFGRKFLFILPCIGTAFRTVSATIGMIFDLPLPYYVPGYFIEGCTGQIFSIFQVASIYASDISKPGKQRSFAIVFIEVAFGIGSALPAIGVGYILTLTNNFLLPMYISCGLLCVSFLLMIALPETFPKDVRTKTQYLNFFDNLKDATDLYFSKTNSGRRWMYVIMLSIFALSSYGVFGRVAVEGLYLLNSPFCFGPDKLGIFNALKTGLQQLLGIVLVVVFLIFTNDEVVCVIGCISAGAAFVLESLATTDWMVYLVSVVGCCGLMVIPMVRSIMSQMTSPQKQGAVYASISVAETTTNIISAVSSNTIYLTTVSIYRGFIFLVYATINFLCLILLGIFMIGTRKTKKKFIEIE